MTEFKNLFVIYPPACGGNHIANLLSLHPIFNPKYVCEGDYEEFIYLNYIKIHAQRNHHSYNSLNVHFDINQKHINDYPNDDVWLEQMLSSDKKNVFTGHHTNFHNLFSNNLLDKFAPYYGIVLSEPKVDSIPFVRNQNSNFNESSPYKDYNVPSKFPPSSNTKFKAVDFITEDNGFLFKSEELFILEGFKLLNQKLLENLGFSLDTKHEILHKFWYELVTAKA